MNMPEDSEHVDRTCTHAEMSCGRSMVTESKAMFSYLFAAACPFPYPKGFAQPQGERRRPRIGPPSQMRGHLLWRRKSCGSPRLKASASHPAPSCGSCIDCSGRSIPRRGELGDELKKPLQALREAGRAKPRWIFAAMFFRLQPVSPISGSNVSQLVTLCLSSPVRNHGSHFALPRDAHFPQRAKLEPPFSCGGLKKGALLQDLPRPERRPGHHQITTQSEGRTATQRRRTRGDSLH